MPRKVVLSVFSALVLALVFTTMRPIQAAVGSLGVPWQATQRWVSSLGSKTIRPTERVASLLRPQRPEQGTGQTGVTVTTDKLDYRPGQIVIVRGSGWQPGSSVELFFDDPAHLDITLITIADGNGNIDTARLDPLNTQDDYQIEDHHIGETLQLTASGFAADGSPAQVTTTFTDAPGANIDQCRNGSATSPSDCVAAGADPD